MWREIKKERGRRKDKGRDLLRTYDHFYCCAKNCGWNLEVVHFVEMEAIKPKNQRSLSPFLRTFARF